jgi:hypothetical protein
MLRTIEATIDAKGNVKLREPITLRGKKRALVTILEDQAGDEISNETALMAEFALSEDWLAAEEDKAWEHLKDLPDLDAGKKGRNGKHSKKGRK